MSDCSNNAPWAESPARCSPARCLWYTCLHGMFPNKAWWERLLFITFTYELRHFTRDFDLTGLRGLGVFEIWRPASERSSSLCVVTQRQLVCLCISVSTAPTPGGGPKSMVPWRDQLANHIYWVLLQKAQLYKWDKYPKKANNKDLNTPSGTSAIGLPYYTTYPHWPQRNDWISSIIPVSTQTSVFLTS